MSQEPLLLHEKDSRGVVTLTLNRPAAFNSLSEDMLAALQAALDRLRTDATARVVVIAVAGRAFCAGHDLKEMRAEPSLDYYERLFALCGRMIKGDECLDFRLTMLLDKTPHGVVAAGIVFVIAQSLKDPHGCVPLLWRSVFVLLQDLQNSIVKRPQLRGHLACPPRIRSRFCLITPQNFPNLMPRMMKRSGDLPNAHSIAMSSPNPSVIVHRKHPWPLKPLAN